MAERRTRKCDEKFRTRILAPFGDDIESTEVPRESDMRGEEEELFRNRSSLDMTEI